VNDLSMYSRREQQRCEVLPGGPEVGEVAGGPPIGEWPWAVAAAMGAPPGAAPGVVEEDVGLRAAARQRSC